MPITHCVTDGILLMVRSGAITVEEEEDAYVRRMDDPDVRPGMPVLADCRNVSPADSTRVVTHLAGRMRADTDGWRHSRVAVVVGDDAEYGMVRVYQALTDSSGPEVQIFRDYDAAWSWLRETGPEN